MVGNPITTGSMWGCAGIVVFTIVCAFVLGMLIAGC